jgi:hypothetical protein
MHVLRYVHLTTSQNNSSELSAATADFVHLSTITEFVGEGILGITTIIVNIYKNSTHTCYIISLGRAVVEELLSVFSVFA